MRTAILLITGSSLILSLACGGSNAAEESPSEDILTDAADEVTSQDAASDLATDGVVEDLSADGTDAVPDGAGDGLTPDVAVDATPADVAASDGVVADSDVSSDATTDGVSDAVPDTAADGGTGVSLDALADSSIHDAEVSDVSLDDGTSTPDAVVDVPSETELWDANSCGADTALIEGSFVACESNQEVGQIAYAPGATCEQVCCVFGYSGCQYRAGQSDFNACAPPLEPQSGGCGDVFLELWSSACVCSG